MAFKSRGMPSQAPNGKNGKSDFVQGALSSVVGWFSDIPSGLKWLFSCLFLWYVFAALAQIDPKAPFKYGSEIISDVVSTRRGLAADEIQRQAKLADEQRQKQEALLDYLKGEIERERLDKKDVEKRLNDQYLILDRRVLEIEILHATKRGRKKER